MAKFVDGLPVTGEPSEVFCFVHALGAKFSFGAVVHEPGVLISFKITIEQSKDKSIIISADTRLSAIACFPLFRI